MVGYSPDDLVLGVVFVKPVVNFLRFHGFQPLEAYDFQQSFEVGAAEVVGAFHWEYA
jgi:hypothetical protein